jgi:hypothetical protein
MPEPPKLLMVNSSPDASGINEPSVRVMVSQQERSEVWTRTLHEFLAVLALDLQL